MREKKMPILSLRCACNRSVFSANTFARAIYNRRDRFLLALGATRRPIRVEIRCAICEFLFGISTDVRLREKSCALDSVTLAELETIDGMS
jgi:hypothetical protein